MASVLIALEPMRRNMAMKKVEGFQGFGEEIGLELSLVFCFEMGTRDGRLVDVIGSVVVVLVVVVVLGRRDLGRRVCQNVGVARRGRVLYCFERKGEWRFGRHGSMRC